MTDADATRIDSDGSPESRTPQSPIPQSPVRYLLRRFAGRRWPTFAGALGLLLFGLALQRIPALFIGVALDALLLDSQTYALPGIPADWIPATRTGQAALTICVLGVAIAAESAAKWYGRLVYEEASLRTLHEIRTTAYETATALSMRFYDAEETGDVLSILNDDVDNLGDLFDGVRDGVLYGGEILTAFAFMLLLNWNLAVVLMLLPVLIAATGRVYAGLLEPRHDEVRASVGTVNGRLRDAVEGLSTVKAFTREERERERVADASAEYKSAMWSTLRLRAVYNRVSWLLAAVGIWGLFSLGAYWILEGPPLFFTQELSAGTLLTFILYTFSFLDPTRRLAVDVINKFESARASSKRVVSLFRSDQRLAEAEDAPELDVTEGRVEYDAVSFSYPSADESTVENVSFAAESGEFVGLVGSTGAGKSTLTRLLFRFYDPDSGAIRIDGRDVAEVSVESLRNRIGYVSQDPFLFHGTVRENVAYANPEVSREAVVTAAKQAGAHEFVTELEEGYDTQIGERGATLSGGQRQRLAIARALVGDPPILVLDEATSHVDNETEAEIQRSLLEMAGDRTVFAIAHRLSTVRDADRILVLDDGRLVEEGTHDELLAEDGTYARLWRIQTGEVAAGDGSVAADSSADESAADKSAADKSAADKSAADKSAADKSAADKSAADESPAGESEVTR
ncbi:ATP-binding cassette domain-containing protein [Halorussus ruber]|uniref:ATP-binding cassette domain-containing protein n=1 Tax=Halorussus ruber TaxID=1126238 RepID=UPI00143DF682|nr:ABC transporter ATP-binding protein [Halorussus ruber]